MSHLEAEDLACARLAEMQHGVLARRQALALGLTAAAIDERLGLHRWIAMLPAVYRIAGVPVSSRMRQMSACLWAGEGAFLSHRTAGMLWQLDGVPELHDVEISIRIGQRKRAGLVLHRIGSGDHPSIKEIDGLMVSGIERTIFDLSAAVPLGPAGLALDDALRRRLTTLDRMWDQWETHGKRGRRGTRALKILLMGRDDREGQLRSRLEAKMLRILKRIDCEPVVPNYRVGDASRQCFLDFAYPSRRLAIETHGAKWHLGIERWKKDLQRDRWLKLRGWSVLYFSWDDVHLEPKKVEEEIRTFLNQQALAG